MKGKELVEFIKENRLEDYDIKLKVWNFKGESAEEKKFKIGNISEKYIDEQKKEAVLYGSEDTGLTQNID